MSNELQQSKNRVFSPLHHFLYTNGIKRWGRSSGILDLLAFNLQELPYVIVVLLIAFTVHEFAHAYVAYKFGDPTAKEQGRVTLNPIQHLDPMGRSLFYSLGLVGHVPFQ